MLTRIRNGQLRGLSKISTPGSGLRRNVLTVLQAEGYIRGFSETKHDNGALEFDIELKYYDGRPVINEIKRVSTPGRRVYSSIKDLRMVRNGLGISILSTPKGVLSDNAARDQNVGGEVLCQVF
jgi:small subunit ribosomal protein S8